MWNAAICGCGWWWRCVSSFEHGLLKCNAEETIITPINKIILSNDYNHTDFNEFKDVDTHLYSSTTSGEFRIDFKTGAHNFCSMALIWPAAILSVLLAPVPFRCGSIRSEMNFKRGTMNTLITSLPSSPKPAIAPYNDDNWVFSFCKALLNSRVIRVCKLLVDAKMKVKTLISSCTKEMVKFA